MNPRRSWSPRALGVLLAYPSLRAAGEASLGMHVIEHVASSVPGIVVDRAYLPGRAKPRLTSVDFGAPPSAFTVIGFSCSFELEYPNIPGMLDMAGIPADCAGRDAARRRGDHVPLVVGGGIAVSANPLPLVPYLDFTFLHDAEGSFRAFLACLARDPPGTDLGAWWDAFDGDRRGIVPSFLHARDAPLDRIFDGVATARHPVDLDTAPVPPRQALVDPADLDASTRAGLGQAFLVETGRGCGRGCRFCLVSHHARPPAFRSAARVAAIIDELQASGQDHGRVALIGSNVADHPDLEAICRDVLRRGMTFSVPSIAIPSAGMIDAIAAAGIKTVTIAPETGSARLRRAINKGIPDDAYASLVSALVAAGVRTVKVYLLAGLPGETGEDRAATLSFLATLKDITAARGARLHVSLNPFVPKQGTPFMVHTTNYLTANFGSFKKTFSTLARDIERVTRDKTGMMSPKDARLQAFLSLGGVDALREVLAARRDPSRSLDAAMDATFSAAAAIHDGGPVPAHLQAIITCSLAFLKQEWARAAAGEPTAPCGDGSCCGCGGCPGPGAG